MSLAGARIRVRSSEGIPDRFTLELQGKDVKLMKCSVVWRSEVQIGVRFDPPHAGNLNCGKQGPEGADAARTRGASDLRSFDVVLPQRPLAPQGHVVPSVGGLAMPDQPEWVRAEELISRLFVAGQRAAQDRDRLRSSTSGIEARHETHGESDIGSRSERPHTVWAVVVGLWAVTVLALLGAFLLVSRWS
jgi:hypothetical protein